ncbi:MAG: hypothetical protein IJY04_07245, partial [Clostridia bacterium]|nr:hypothetical protein [Clostridia bacterium]
PEVVEKSTFTCGDEVAVNVLANCESIRVDSPLGNVSYLNTDGAVGNFVLNEVGEYTVTMTVSGTQRQFNIFSAMIEEERATSVLMDSVALQGEAGGGGFDGRFDPLTLLFIVLAIVFSADWMVYCYEKYQLR